MIMSLAKFSSQRVLDTWLWHQGSMFDSMCLHTCHTACGMRLLCAVISMESHPEENLNALLEYKNRLEVSFRHVHFLKLVRRRRNKFGKKSQYQITNCSQKWGLYSLTTTREYTAFLQKLPLLAILSNPLLSAAQQSIQHLRKALSPLRMRMYHNSVYHSHFPHL